jgi:hypothetical protein
MRFVTGSMATLLLVGALSGCLRPAPPARVSVASVTVLPPENETGDPLVISGESLLEKYLLGTERYTVSDALAAVARAALTRQGFVVVAPAEVSDRPSESATGAAAQAAGQGVEGAMLYTEIRRWEPDDHYEPRFVIAAVSVRLVDAKSGRIVWSADHASRPVETPGAINFGQAYAIAAEKLMLNLLAPLTP